MDFRWNDWNVEHLARHGVSIQEAESVVSEARPPYPVIRGEEKLAVWGRGIGGRPLQVIFVLDEDDTVFVIHARPLTAPEKRRFRRSERP